ncbi:putative uncharacterized protein DDB_G0277255 [Spodoptera frugiperda]|uniref:TRAF-type domain-containing protein n=1 Tax=Spodoptera frugiperda TaxID=7108 RepID=A0A9R0DCM5_SPOFR|nr:putative uncharacterized protein DDB_G0277255 [Spodoptera frugiperda]
MNPDTEGETKLCENCKREIPTVNFTIHSVHCARNIRVCPVCKEAVLYAELKEHHDKMHKLQPCKKCGESVCGTDLEDHIRDSCAHTIKTCRFCELELPRRDLPAHESYCGVRTEQCPDCKEWVMIKYRQLHLDSNHGFIRLDDDPSPVSPKKELPKSPARPAVPKLVRANIATATPSTSNGCARPFTDSYRPNGLKNINLTRTETRQFSTNGARPGPSPSPTASTSSNWRGNTSPTNGAKVAAKRTNDKPQINTNVEETNKVDKDLGVSRGAVKKRPAPKPPCRRAAELPPSAIRDLPYYSAMQRQQDEERQRQDQTAYNLSVGLPPVLSPAAKLDRLRKMDMLQNPEEHLERNRQGRVVRNSENDGASSGASEEPRRRNDFRNLTPMTPQEFMERFSEMQLRKDEETRRNSAAGDGRKNGDRFSEIKSSLRELRRGLNEVTAPYHSNPNISVNANNNNNNNGNGRASPAGDDVRLPCEFCACLIPAHNLVQHQTGCRPDLAQLRPRSPSPVGAVALEPSQEPYEEPVIPCEFCYESLPVYLISEHQERCGREANLLYPD